MMKKNFLGKFMVLAAMIYAGFTLSSCDEKDNPSGNNWTELKVTNKTATSATVTANSASEVNSLIASLSKDIKAAVTDGKDYTITIDVPSLKVTETNHTISLPAPASGEDGGTLILYIKNSFSTDGTPLLVKSNEAYEGNWSYNSNSKAEILLPAGISDIDLEINMPHTTVTLDSKGNATIDELVSLTAWETLIIENGITVNWISINDSKAILKKGGKVLGALIKEWNQCNIYLNGVQIPLFENEIPEGFYDLSWDERKEYYTYVNKAKIKKGEEDGYSTVWIEAGYEEPKEVAEVEVTIEDGANVRISHQDSWANYYPIVNFTGEGDNARIIAQGYKDGEKGFTIGNGNFLRPINKLTNVTVDVSTCFASFYDEEGNWVNKEVETEFMYGPLYLPHSSESCTIKAHGFEYNVPEDFSSTSASFKDCTFEYANIKTDNDEDLQLCLKVNFPSETKARTAFDLGFDTCDFSKVFQFQVNYWGYFKKYEGFITLDNTTMAKKAVTKDTKMIKYVNRAADGEQNPPVYYSTTFFVIDGTTYEPIEKDGVWKLIPVDD